MHSTKTRQVRGFTERFITMSDLDNDQHDDTIDDDSVDTVEETTDVVDHDDADDDDGVVDADRDDADYEDDGEDDSAPKPKMFDESYVKNLRKEAADARTKGKKAAQEAADRAREEFARDLFGALGLTEDDEDITPDELIELANSQRDEARTALREYEIKDAVVEAAKDKADVGLLIPHLRGERKLDKLDPNDEDFADQVSEIVDQALTRHPKLKLDSPAPKRSGGDLSNGNGEPKRKKGPRTIEEIRADRRKHRESKYGAAF